MLPTTLGDMAPMMVMTGTAGRVTRMGYDGSGALISNGTTRCTQDLAALLSLVLQTTQSAPLYGCRLRSIG